MNPNNIHLAPSKSPTSRAIGLQHHQENLTTLPTGHIELQLIPEPDNPYDQRAISVRHQGRVIGYIPREETSKYWQSVARIARHKKIPIATAEVRDIGNKWPLVNLYIKPGKDSLPANLQNTSAVKPAELPKAYKQTTALAYARIAKDTPKPNINKGQGPSPKATTATPGKSVALSAVGCVALMLIGIPWPLAIGAFIGALFYIFKKDKP